MATTDITTEYFKNMINCLIDRYQVYTPDNWSHIYRGCKHWSSFANWRSSLDYYLDRGEIQACRWVENAMIANSQGQLQGNSSAGQDFSDGSDAKTMVVQKCSNLGRKRPWRWVARLKNMKNKKGLIRAVIYHPAVDQCVFLKIPAVWHGSSTHTFDFYPDRCEMITNRMTPFVVDNFTELCQ